ncbi:hypothetical protein ACVIGB_000704 [Bradyrhizobium sp. USDA 4341]
MSQPNEPNTAKRQSIAARIRALLAKTVANGCTEDEAIAAAEKAAALLEQYNLSMDEIEMRASPFAGAEQAHTDDDVGPRFYTVANAISALTGARNWISPPGVHPVVYSFFGMTHEVEIAQYLLDICARAVRSECAARDGEWAFYRLSVRRTKRIAFRDGMADSLSKRIRALKPKTRTGTGLIVLHDALIDEEMIRRGLAIRTRRQPGSFDFDDSYLEGRAAGDLVALDPGIKSPERVSGVLPGQTSDTQ